MTFSSISFASEKLNRFTLFDLGYSTATKGFGAVGYGREISDGHLLSAYIGSWSSLNKEYYGVNYKYFLEDSVAFVDSWFIGGNLQKNDVKGGEFSNVFTAQALGGYQWVFFGSLTAELDASIGYTEDGDGSLGLGASFSFLF